MWRTLPTDLQLRIANTVSPRNMRSLGRAGPAAAAIADTVHAGRVARNLEFRTTPQRVARVMTNRTLTRSLIAAVETASAVGWTASLDTLRRGGFHVQWRDAGHWAAVKRKTVAPGVRLVTRIIRHSQHHHDYENDRVYVNLNQDPIGVRSVEFDVFPDESTVRVTYGGAVQDMTHARFEDVAMLAVVRAALARRGLRMTFAPRHDVVQIAFNDA